VKLSSSLFITTLRQAELDMFGPDQVGCVSDRYSDATLFSFIQLAFDKSGNTVTDQHIHDRVSEELSYYDNYDSHYADKDRVMTFMGRLIELLHGFHGDVVVYPRVYTKGVLLYEISDY